MFFKDVDIKYITNILYNIYKSVKKLEKKKKLDNIPCSFEAFIKQHIKDGLCPNKCLNYVREYVI